MAKRAKIITFGAAVLDVFLSGENLHAQRDVRSHSYVEQFPLGAKIELDNVTFSTGGGATNAAVTFGRAGFETSFMGKIGDDIAGREIIKDLKNEEVNPNLIKVDTSGITGYSTLLLATNGERTVLVYRGVSEQLKANDFDLSKLRADWLYITSLGGNISLLETVVNKAHSFGTKIAIDPGSRELKEAKRLMTLLPKLTLIKGNASEMAQVFGGKSAEATLRLAATRCPYVIVSDGARGSWASDGKRAYFGGMYKDVKVLDRTGAGDAFGSGFVAALAHGESMEHALTFASANSTSVVRYIGAKKGILSLDTKLNNMPIKISNL